MIYDINDIRKLLLSKGYIWKGTVFYSGSKILIHTKDDDAFYANVSVSNASFKIKTPYGEYDFSEDWIKLLLKTYPQEETSKAILKFIQSEEDFITEQAQNRLKELKEEMTKIRNTTSAQAEKLNVRKHIVLSYMENFEDFLNKI